jgi:hypothetical protein
VIAGILLAAQVAAQNPAAPAAPAAPVAQAVRVDQTPRVDGRLTEAVWRTAPAISGFTQREPDEGVAAPENTEVRIAYDDDALYVGARMYSRNPRDIRALVMKHDNVGSSETIAISLDTYRDRRTAYTFAVTPAGVRIDFYHSSDDEDDEDEEWNPVWLAVAHVDSLGWTAEMRIPFSQLRFNPVDAQEWGINVHRKVPVRQEASYWVHIGRTESGWSSRMGTLTGIRGIKPSRRMEALPYIAADSRATADYDPGDPFNKQYTNRARFGGDLKVGLGPNLTLDATINPDFGQVEGDPAVVNLSAYETFFGERRPFFLEGSDLYGGRNLFYSRRIGAQPPGSASADYVERRANTTILGAAKLTGRLPSGLSVAALAAVTDRETVRTFDSLGTPQFGSAVVAPRSAYAVATARQEFGKNASTVSGMVTAMQRDLGATDALSNLLPRAAYSGLVDSRLRWAGGKYDASAYVGFANVLGEAPAVTRLQRSSRRYFQRPDADHVGVDSTRRSLSGTMFGVNHSKMAGKHWLWDIDFSQESPGLELNDAGRSGAVDNRFLFTRLRWRETTPARWYRRYDMGFGTENSWNFDGLHRPSENFVFFNATLPNYWETSVDFTYIPRAVDDRLTRGGPVMGTPAAAGWSVELEGREGARVEWSVDAGHGRDENGSWEQELALRLNVHPGVRWFLSFDPEWTRASDARQFIQTESNGRPETFGTRYIFGRVDLSEISAELRLNYTFTPNLTLETYAQPFAASGRYRNFGELSLPRQRDLHLYGTGGSTITPNPDGSHTVTADGQTFDIDRQDFNERSVRTNAVLRWEWRPGSTLYLVWQQNRERERPIADARPRHVLEAFGTRADNFVAVKVSYWMPLGW